MNSDNSDEIKEDLRKPWKKFVTKKKKKKSLMLMLLLTKIVCEHVEDISRCLHSCETVDFLSYVDFNERKTGELNENGYSIIINSDIDIASQFITISRVLDQCVHKIL